jgi:hypothetical protein
MIMNNEKARRFIQRYPTWGDFLTAVNDKSEDQQKNKRALIPLRPLGDLVDEDFEGILGAMHSDLPIRNATELRLQKAYERVHKAVKEDQGRMRDVAEGASELWHDAYEQGRRYYRQGSQAIGHADSVTISGWVVAGAIGFGLAWLIFGHRSTDDVARRMSESSERYPRRR